MKIEPDANSAASSTADENLEASAAEAATEIDANAAESSDADDKDANQPESLLAVVQDAVKKPDEAEAGSSAAEGTEEAQPGAEAEEKPEGQTDAEAQAEADAKLPFHTHPRWKEVVAERDGFRPDAEAYRNITGFMEHHGLTGDEVATGFDIMSKLKSRDPKDIAEARDYFAKGLSQLDGLLGNVLPDDLQEKVESGLLDEETAQELAQARATTALHSERLEARETADANAEAERTRVATAEANATAVNDWEVRTKAADPDYSKKAALVETTCRAIVHRTGNIPKTPAESVALCDAALKEVNDQFKSFLPKRQPVATTPRGSSATATQEPKTLREAIADSLNR